MQCFKTKGLANPFKRVISIVLTAALLITMSAALASSVVKADGTEPLAADNKRLSAKAELPPSEPEHHEPQFAPDRVIVKLAKARSGQRTASSKTVSPLSDLGVNFSQTRLLNPAAETPGDRLQTHSVESGNRNNVYVLTLTDMTVEEALKILNANPVVEIAEPDYLMKVSVTSNDPEYDAQYALQTINAERVWGITKGSKDIVVGIIDTGIEGTHPDLIDNLWVNPNPGQNGYINDIHGYNFTGQGNDGIPVGGIPTDIGGHGTHVAGIIGAKSNNGEGIAGINWDVSLAWLGIHMGGDNVSTSMAIEALNYANNNNIPITNNSYGGYNYSQTFYEAIRDYNGLFVAAAGNDSNNNDIRHHYPSDYDLPNVIAVASTNQNNDLSWFSNYGESSAHIAAPGSDILSTYLNGEYTSLSGTSMASPYVAGVAALIMAANPGYDIDQVKSAILAGAELTPELTGKVKTSGILDAYRSFVPRPPAESITIIPDTLTLDIYGSSQLTVKTLPANASQAALWESSDPAVVNVNSSGGVIALKSGTAEITACLIADPSKSATVTITVTDHVLNIVPFMDLNFKQAVIDELKVMDSSVYGNYTIADNLQPEDVQKIISLILNDLGIADMTGIEFFTNLRVLICDNNKLTKLNVSNSPNLSSLDCFDNLLTELDVSNNPKLQWLNCSNNKLTKLNMSYNPSLSYLECSNNQLTELDVPNNPALWNLNCSNNQLTNLDVSNSPALTMFFCYSNQLTRLDISNNPVLQFLECEKNQLTELDVSNNLMLERLFCNDNRLIEMDLNGLTDLTSYRGYNQTPVIAMIRNEAAERYESIPIALNNPTNLASGLTYTDGRLVSAIEIMTSDFAVQTGRAGFALSGTLVLEYYEELPLYSITATAGTGGSVTGSGSYNHGSNVTLTATANTGYTFDGWYEDSTRVSTNATFTFTATAARTLQARFTLNQYTITATAGTGGSVTGGGSYDHGTSVTLTATVSSGYTFDGWYEDGARVSSNAILTFTATAVRTLQARFHINTYTVSYSANGGSGAPQSQTKTHGIPLTLSSAAPTRTGYTFLGWSTSSTAATATYAAGGSFPADEDTTLYAVWKSLTSISVTRKPSKQIYIEGEALDTDGMLVTATYSNGDSEIITAGLTIGYDFAIIGTRTVTVEYGGKSASFTVSVTAKTLVSISVTQHPAKLFYTAGESLNTAGMVVTAYYNNATNAAVTGYTVQSDLSTSGTKTVTVTYQAKTASFTVTVNALPTITSSTHTINGTTISKISVGSTAAKLLAGVNNNASVKIFNGSTQITGNTTVGTGMQMRLYNGSDVIQTLTIVITGDVTGSGNISWTGITKIVDHMVGKTQLAGAYAEAAKISGGSNVSWTDVTKMVDAMLGKSTITSR